MQDPYQMNWQPFRWSSTISPGTACRFSLQPDRLSGEFVPHGSLVRRSTMFASDILMAKDLSMETQKEHPNLFPRIAYRTMSLEAISDLPMVINGRSYLNWRHHLDRLKRLTRPILL